MDVEEQLPVEVELLWVSPGSENLPIYGGMVNGGVDLEVGLRVQRGIDRLDMSSFRMLIGDTDVTDRFSHVTPISGGLMLHLMDVVECEQVDEVRALEGHISIPDESITLSKQIFLRPNPGRWHGVCSN
ncbi:MAG: hypothetical protein QGG50_05610 [Methanopyri archaeon]|nr:hypothetical protein [Methanopyri archaeon]